MTNHSGQQLKGVSEGSPGPVAGGDAVVEKQPSRPQSQSSSSSMADSPSEKNNASQKMRVLYCRKCEGHGVQAILKGHAPTCPYNLCNCKSCEKLMTKRLHSFNKRNKSRLEAAAALTAARNRLRAEALANNLDPEEADLQLSNRPQFLRALLTGSPTGGMDNGGNAVIDINQSNQPCSSKSVSPRLDDTRCSPNSNLNEMNAMSYDIWLKLTQNNSNNNKKTSNASSSSDRTTNSSPGTRKRSYDFIKNVDESRNDTGIFSVLKDRNINNNADDDEIVTIPSIPPVTVKIRRSGSATIVAPPRKESRDDAKQTTICQPTPVLGNSGVAMPALPMGQKMNPRPSLVNAMSTPQPINIPGLGIPQSTAVPAIRPSVVSNPLMPHVLPSFTTSSNTIPNGIASLSPGVISNPLIPTQPSYEHLQNELHALKNYCQELQKQIHMQQSQPAPSLMSMANPLTGFPTPNPVLHHQIPSSVPVSNHSYMDLVQQQMLINSLGMNTKDRMIDSIPTVSPNDKLGLPQMFPDGASLQSFVNQLNSLAVLGHDQTSII